MAAVIAYIIEVVLLLWLTKILYNIIRAIVLRARFYIKLKNICDSKGYLLRKNRPLFASFFIMSKKADIFIEANGTYYFVRLLTCFAYRRAYHFINERRYIRFARFGYILPMTKNINKISFFETMKTMPAFTKERGENVKQILLFNPSPMEIFWLDEKRMNKALVWDGMEMYGWNVFGAKGFLDLLNEI